MGADLRVASGMVSMRCILRCLEIGTTPRRLPTACSHFFFKVESSLGPRLSCSQSWGPVDVSFPVTYRYNQKQIHGNTWAVLGQNCPHQGRNSPSMVVFWLPSSCVCAHSVQSLPQVWWNGTFWHPNPPGGCTGLVRSLVSGVHQFSFDNVFIFWN